MGLFDNLLGYKRVKRYDTTKARKDERLHVGYNYDALPPSEFIGRSFLVTFKEIKQCNIF